MTRPTLAVVAIAAFVTGLLVLPNTRWIIPNQIEMLTGGWKLAPQNAFFSEDLGPIPLPAHLVPRPSVLTVSTPRSDEERLFALLREAPEWHESRAYWGRFSALEAVCRRLDSAPMWAQFLRLASNPARSKGGDAGFAQEREQLQTMFLAACVQGARLDPDNAFFPVMQGAVLEARGDIEGSTQALLQASQRPRFRAYEWTEVTMGTRALESRYPRSKAATAWLAATVLLPHLAAIRTATRALSEDGNPAHRAIACRIGGLILRDGTSPLDPFVGVLILSHGLKPEGKKNLLTRLDPKEALARAEALAKATGDGRLVGLAHDYQRIYPALKNGRFARAVEATGGLNTLAPLFGATVLVALLALPLLAFLEPLRSRMAPRFHQASPALAWLFAIPLALAGIPGGSPLPTELAAIAVLAPLAFFLRKKSLVGLLSGVAALAVVVALPGCPSAWVLAGIVIVAATLAPNVQVGGLAAVVSRVAACMLVGGIAVFAGLLGLGWGAAVLGLGPMLIFSLLLPSAPRRRRADAASACWVALGTLYVIGVLVAVRTDSQAGAVLDAWLNEAASVRGEWLAGAA